MTNKPENQNIDRDPTTGEIPADSAGEQGPEADQQASPPETGTDGAHDAPVHTGASGDGALDLDDETPVSDPVASVGTVANQQTEAETDDDATPAADFDDDSPSADLSDEENASAAAVANKDSASSNVADDTGSEETAEAEAEAALTGEAVAVRRSKKRFSTTSNIAAGLILAAIAGALIYNFFGDPSLAKSRMTKGPERIDGTPAGTQLASSEAYRNTLNNANQLGAENARKSNRSFMATPDEQVKQRAKPKRPTQTKLVQAPALPPANEKARTVTKIVHDRPKRRAPTTNWDAINDMAKNMDRQAGDIAKGARIPGTKKKIIVEQDLYEAPDGKPVGVEVGDGRGDPTRPNLSFNTGLNASAHNTGNASGSTQRNHAGTRRSNDGQSNDYSSNGDGGNDDGVISSVYQADLMTTSPYYTGHLEREPSLPVDVGHEFGAGSDRSPALGLRYLAAAGTMTYAVIVNGADTDTPGPVVAKILDGPLKNARLIGSFKANDETTNMIVSFDRVVLPSGQNLDTSAYAIDATDAKLAVRSDYDGRYLQRYGATLAGAFIGGLGNALGNSGTTVVASDGATIITDPAQSTRQALFSGLGRAGDVISRDVENLGPDGPIVSLNAGQLVGILFLENVTRTSRR